MAQKKPIKNVWTKQAEDANKQFKKRGPKHPDLIEIKL